MGLGSNIGKNFKIKLPNFILDTAGDTHLTNKNENGKTDLYIFDWTKPLSGRDVIVDQKGPNIVMIKVQSLSEFQQNGSLLFSLNNKFASIDLTQANIQKIRLIDIHGNKKEITLSNKPTTSPDFNRFKVNNLARGQALTTRSLTLIDNKVEGMLN